MQHLGAWCKDSSKISDSLEPYTYMSLFQALIMALLQGATELFPVSSLGHAVVLPALLHWSYDLHDPTFLPFLVMLHMGTSVALLIFSGRTGWLCSKAHSGRLGIASSWKVCIFYG